MPRWGRQRSGGDTDSRLRKEAQEVEETRIETADRAAASAKAVPGGGGSVTPPDCCRDTVSYSPR